VLAVVPRRDVSIASESNVDGSTSSRLAFAGVQVAAENVIATGAEAQRLARQLQECLMLGAAAELVGLAAAALAVTLEHIKLRQQFGRPIGSFQVGAEEAMRMGLVHELCDADAADAALARLIDELLLAGPNALAQAKRLFLRFAPAPAPPSPELLGELQREFEQGFNAPEAAEGRASFREKRKPRWAMPQQDP
jgi:alkylation response protein AidB-like acyl-CoA dehydrogenase